MLVKFKDELEQTKVFKGYRPRCYILLPDELNREVLNGYGGMWYGDDPLSAKSYGKAKWEAIPKDVVIIRENIDGMSLSHIKRLVD